MHVAGPASVVVGCRGRYSAYQASVAPRLQERRQLTLVCVGLHHERIEVDSPSKTLGFLLVQSSGFWCLSRVWKR